MAKIYTVDDYELYAEMFADMLRQEGGHEVRAVLSPLNLADLEAFDPEVVVVTLVRRLETLGHGPLVDFLAEVDGAKGLQGVVASQGARPRPIIVVSMGVRESEIPPALRPDVLLHLPQQLDNLLGVIERLVAARRAGDATA